MPDVSMHRGSSAVSATDQDIGRPTFEAQDAAVDVAQRTCGWLLDVLRLHEARVCLDSDPEDLHKMRVTTRRLRATISALRECFPVASVTPLVTELKWMAGELGRIRDLDVHSANVEKWRSHLPPGHERGWERLEAVLEERRERARSQVLSSLLSDRWKALTERCSALLADEGRVQTQGSVADVAARVLRKRARRFRLAEAECMRVRDPASSHRLRIAGKRMRYTAELFIPLFSKRFLRRVKRFAEFQDVLGKYQDWVVAGMLVEELRRETEVGESEYLYVLGEVAGLAAARGRFSQRRVKGALRALGGSKTAAALAGEARRALKKQEQSFETSLR